MPQTDPLSDGQSIVSNNVITEPCTNKRSKPEMASESQIGLRNNQFQVTITVIEARQLMGTNMDPVVEVKGKVIRPDFSIAFQ